MPNPIHDKGVVRYTLKNNGTTGISIYNSQGIEVKQAKQLVQISGSHEVAINCSDLESGLYDFSIYQNGHFVGAQKLIVQ